MKTCSIHEHYKGTIEMHHKDHRNKSVKLVTPQQLGGVL